MTTINVVTSSSKFSDFALLNLSLRSSLGLSSTLQFYEFSIEEYYIESDTSVDQLLK